MWNRAELKSRGKIAFKANYWRSVLVAFLAMLVTGAGATYSSSNNYQRLSGGSTGDMAVSDPGDLVILGLIGTAIFILVLIVIAIDILLINPLVVGCNYFFLRNRQDPSTDINTLSRGFKPNYKNVVIGLFMTDLFISLWALLLIVPGIIKSYEYRMVPYLLAEDTSLDYKSAQAKSREMMMGQKWNAFVLDLSFIGWALLGGLTLGLLNLFYVNPYIQATNAELYVALAHPEAAGAQQNYSKQDQTVEFVVDEVSE